MSTGQEAQSTDAKDDKEMEATPGLISGMLQMLPFSKSTPSNKGRVLFDSHRQTSRDQTGNIRSEVKSTRKNPPKTTSHKHRLSFHGPRGETSRSLTGNTGTDLHSKQNRLLNPTKHKEKNNTGASGSLTRTNKTKKTDDKRHRNHSGKRAATGSSTSRKEIMYDDSEDDDRTDSDDGMESGKKKTSHTKTTGARARHNTPSRATASTTQIRRNDDRGSDHENFNVRTGYRCDLPTNKHARQNNSEQTKLYNAGDTDTKDYLEYLLKKNKTQMKNSYYEKEISEEFWAIWTPEIVLNIDVRTAGKKLPDFQSSEYRMVSWATALVAWMQEMLRNRLKCNIRDRPAFIEEGQYVQIEDFIAELSHMDRTYLFEAMDNVETFPIRWNSYSELMEEDHITQDTYSAFYGTLPSPCPEHQFWNRFIDHFDTIKRNNDLLSKAMTAFTDFVEVSNRSSGLDLTTFRVNAHCRFVYNMIWQFTGKFVNGVELRTYDTQANEVCHVFPYNIYYNIQQQIPDHGHLWVVEALIQSKATASERNENNWYRQTSPKVSWITMQLLFNLPEEKIRHMVDDTVSGLDQKISNHVVRTQYFLKVCKYVCSGLANINRNDHLYNKIVGMSQMGNRSTFPTCGQFFKTITDRYDRSLKVSDEKKHTLFTETDTIFIRMVEIDELSFLKKEESSSATEEVGRKTKKVRRNENVRSAEFARQRDYTTKIQATKKETMDGALRELFTAQGRIGTNIQAPGHYARRARRLETERNEDLQILTLLQEAEETDPRG